MRLTNMFGAAVMAGTLFIAGPSFATTIAPVGTTDVVVSEVALGALEGAGLTAAPISPATVRSTGLTFSFNITGGNLDELLVTHSGGVSFSAGTSELTASNFTIDGLAGTVSADVFSTNEALGSISQVAIFDLADVDTSGPIVADLLINSTLNGAFGLTFADGADLGLTGAVFGTATTSPAPIPLPAAMPLMLLGFGAFGLLRVRRKKAMA